MLAAAAELFARHGFHGVGIDDIGSAVGISGPGLYRHFRSKDAMLGEMLVTISEKLLAGGRERVARAADPQEALGELVRWHIDFALDNPSLITVHERNLANLAEEDQRRVRALQRAYVEVWVQVICQVVPDTEEPAARAAAHAVFGLLNSTPHSAHLDRTAMAELLHRMAMAALTTPGAIAVSSEGDPAASH
ncbi:MAG TPA: TetR/AcrR family transcriptional regulator [Pseudonocardiaceae bacterium]